MPDTAPARRILIVEDVPDVADSLRVVFEVLGHEVRVAYNGPDGVSEADTWRPDAVVCDIGLPGLDGYGVAQELTRLSVRSKARLIAVTGYSDADARSRASACGFHHFFTKPADPMALARLIEGGGAVGVGV